MINNLFIIYKFVLYINVFNLHTFSYIHNIPYSVVSTLPIHTFIVTSIHLTLYIHTFIHTFIHTYILTYSEVELRASRPRIFYK